MKVSELIKFLADYPPDTKIFMRGIEFGKCGSYESSYWEDFTISLEHYIPGDCLEIEGYRDV